MEGINKMACRIVSKRMIYFDASILSLDVNIYKVEEILEKRNDQKKVNWKVN